LPQRFFFFYFISFNKARKKVLKSTVLPYVRIDMVIRQLFLPTFVLLDFDSVP